MTTTDGVCDLRSDTVTLPSSEMRAAIAAAPVGDDQFGEDPAVNLLQERIAALLGKEAALWLPTGTMANQVALRVLTHPGDDVIVSRESHAVWHETGGAAANSGVQFTAIGDRGVFTVDEFLVARANRRGICSIPPTTLVEIENTHNRAGGIIFPQDEAERICNAAREHGVASYLDGARLWNTAIASGRPPAELAAPFDLVSVALSKGLGAPGGSLLAGASDLMMRAVRHRRMLGGAMRQVGLFAAAGSMRLTTIWNDSQRTMPTRAIAERLAASRRIILDPATVQTNILVFGLTARTPQTRRSCQPSGLPKAVLVIILDLANDPDATLLVFDVSTARCPRRGPLSISAAIVESVACPTSNGAYQHVLRRRIRSSPISSVSCPRSASGRRLMCRLKVVDG